MASICPKCKFALKSSWQAEAVRLENQSIFDDLDFNPEPA